MTTGLLVNTGFEAVRARLNQFNTTELTPNHRTVEPLLHVCDAEHTPSVLQQLWVSATHGNLLNSPNRDVLAVSTLWLLPTSPTKLHVFIELILVYQPIIKITPQNQENSGGDEHVLGKCVRVRCELIAKSPTQFRTEFSL